MKKYQILIITSILLAIGLVDFFVIRNESIKMGIFSATFFLVIMVNRLIRRNPWCKNAMMAELLLAFIYLGISGGLIFGPKTIYFLEFSLVMLFGLFSGLLEKQTVSSLKKADFFGNIKRIWLGEKTIDVKLYFPDNRLPLCLHFGFILLYLPVLIFFSSFWVLSLFSFLLTGLSFLTIDNSKYGIIIVKEQVFIFNKIEKRLIPINELAFQNEGFVWKNQRYRRSKCLEKELFQQSKK